MIGFRRYLSYCKLGFCERTLANFCTSVNIFSPCETVGEAFQFYKLFKISQIPQPIFRQDLGQNRLYLTGNFFEGVLGSHYNFGHYNWAGFWGRGKGSFALLSG